MFKTKSLAVRLWGLLLILSLFISVLASCAPKEGTPTTQAPGQTTSPKPESPVATIIWRANSITDPTRWTNMDEYYGKLMRDIVERTNGRLEIQTHWNNELGFGHREYPKLLQQGFVEISDLPMLMGDLYIPAVSYESIPIHLGPPFSSELAVEVHKARRPIYDDMLAAWNGKRLVTFWYRSNMDAPLEIVANKPFRTLDDFKGSTTIASNPTTAAFWATFGIKSVTIPMPEYYMALKTGLVESTVSMSRSGWKSYKLHEVAKYNIVYYPGQPNLTSYGWAASIQHWNKLPPDLQKIVADLYREYEDRVDREIGLAAEAPENAYAEEIIRDYKIEVINLPAEDQAKIQELADRSMAEWLAKADDLGKRLYKSDMTALGRPERYDQLLQLGLEITGKK